MERLPAGFALPTTELPCQSLAHDLWLSYLQYHKQLKVASGIERTMNYVALRSCERIEAFIGSSEGMVW